MQAPKHPQETARLNLVAQYGILDTPEEPEFDAIARLAAVICDAPVALVSILDRNRQWFKAHHGTDLTETPLEQSICGHAVLGDGLLEIEDTAADPRTTDNPLCIGGDAFRFYAGAPIVDGSGLPVGTVCVLDQRPRTLSGAQQQALSDLADQAMRLIKLRSALSDAELVVQETNHRIKNSLQSVSAYVRLQRANLVGAGEDALAAFRATETRIGSVAALHEALCYSAVGERVDLAGYAERILSLTMANAPGHVRGVVEIEPCRVSSRQASALGTIFSEFVSNSVRHGFPDGRAGAIRLAGRFDGDGRMRIECSDDGVGLAAGPVPGGLGGLGFRIIEGAIQQLDAEKLELTAGDGTRLALVFEPE
ncbi:histidine kinase dimerization/phosphoacceptor domain -containing protein [Wenxinia marina]|uniref:Signal transduction histidine kinase n=1 Tax=Wenxinia marina DSM 24838 TaxID=1123501 RepID=A0A0D0P773_9RHOB|nr:histidine kinase dimerization/phosphoacceptor domain -containing protein [Wenxinia marina]KIQ67436.1 Signal transduction histidine kinase [Wenxinia marina DSM 24838]GGL69540.1 hypothetical protein GCM10011392_25000 [Wenxinia marina]